MILKCNAFQTVFEKIIWIVLIVLVLYSLSTDIRSALEIGALETDISLVPIDEIPFPAIIVDLSGEVDPVGYIAASKDIAHEDGFNKEGEGFSHLRKMFCV